MSLNPGNILEFWFGSLSDGIADDNHRSRWYAVDAAFDEACAGFKSLYEDLDAGILDAWLETPNDRLAYIILTDQLSRNIFRGTARAFATDNLALAASREGIELGADAGLGVDERCFFYMPFEHSESIIDQHTSVGLFSNLRDQHTGKHKEIAGQGLRYAHQHRDIIERFGRFPHRNGVLGRESTAEEAEFVADSDGFGQSVP